MAIDFPTNTLLVIIMAMIGVAAGVWLLLSQGLSRAGVAPQARRALRRGIGPVLLIWLLLRLAFALTSLTLFGPRTQFLVTVTFLGLGLLGGILPLTLSPAFRQIIRAIPATWLVGIHALRIFGFLFLALMDMHLLPAEFAIQAGYGDMMVGLLALGLAYLLAQGNSSARALAIGWNALGLLDLVAAVMTGSLFIGPFVAQVTASGVSPLYVNFVLMIPSFGVPIYAVLHIYSLFQLVSARADTTTGDEAPIFAGKAGTVASERP